MQEHNKNDQKNTSVFDSEAMQALLMGVVSSFAFNLMDDEIGRLKSSLEAYRWGSQQGFMRFMGQRLPIDRPRVRHKQDKRELRLESYEQLQGKDQWTKQMCDMVLGGLATRQFDKLGQVVGSAYGLSKSQISRHVVNGLQRDYDALMATDCSDVVALLIDGKGFGKKPNEVCLIATLGITHDGTKKLLGIWSGGTENSGMVKQLLDDLIKRGLEEPKLTVLDGSKALHKAITDKWSEAVIARCQIHKQRNVLSHVSESQVAWVTDQYNRIIHATSYEEGSRQAQILIKQLAKVNVSASNSMAEGLNELFVPLLIKDANLRRFFSSTNAIESVFSMLQTKTGRVRRWRSANSVMFWVATAYRQQQKNLHRVKGHKFMAELGEIKFRLKQAKENLGPAAGLIATIQKDERRLKVG